MLLLLLFLFIVSIRLEVLFGSGQVIRVLLLLRTVVVVTTFVYLTVYVQCVHAM